MFTTNKLEGDKVLGIDWGIDEVGLLRNSCREMGLLMTHSSRVLWGFGRW
jgi:hypothetical protein